MTFIGSLNFIFIHIFVKPTFFLACQELTACLPAESSRMDIANGHVRRSPSFMHQNFPTNHHYGGLSSQDPCSYFLKLSILVCHVASAFGYFMDSMLGIEHTSFSVFICRYVLFLVVFWNLVMHGQHLFHYCVPGLVGNA